MIAPWICYTPIDVSPRAYELVVKNNLTNLRLNKLAAVISLVKNLLKTDDLTAEERSLAQYVLGECLYRNRRPTDYPSIIKLMEQVRIANPINVEMRLASYFLQASALTELDRISESIECLETAAALGRPYRMVSLRWGLCVRGLANRVEGLEEKGKWLDEILDSGTVWQDLIVDAFLLKSGVLNRPLRKNNAAGTAISQQIVSDPRFQRIHWEERLQRALMNYLLEDYELAIDEFTEIIESLIVNHVCSNEMHLLRAFQARGDSYFALGLNELAEEDWASAKLVAQEIRAEVERFLD